MKKIPFYSIILAASFFITSCKQKEKLPPSVKTVQEATKLIIGKKWQVVDVATILGSANSVFSTDKLKNDDVVVPAVENVNWMSIDKDISDFEKTFYKDNLKISIDLNKDSIAKTTGMEAEKQIFSINNTSEENKPKGIKLTLTGDSPSFSSMGASKFTATYYILGASENKLYVLTPNKLNSSEVVFLLEAK